MQTAIVGQEQPRAETGDSRRAELRADVAAMRELGVLRWGAILLGPQPAPLPSATSPLGEKEAADARAAEEREARRAHFENLFNRPVGDEELGRIS